jgi:hypothetical protein
MQSETAFPSSVKGAAIAGFKEFWDGIRHWPVSHLIGIRELRHRYTARSSGSFWLTLSTASMIGMLACYLVAAVETTDPRSGAVHGRVCNYMELPVTRAHRLHDNFQQSSKLRDLQEHDQSHHPLRCSVQYASSADSASVTLIGMVWLGYVVAMICVRFRDIIQGGNLQKC